MVLNSTQTLFLLSTLLGAIGLIVIIYSRDSEAKKSRLFILTLILVIGYIVSHSIHFLIMNTGDVTILDLSCHSFLLMIIITLTFFTWNFPYPQKMGILRSLMILIPSLALLTLLWTGNLIRESHAHDSRFEAYYTFYYPLFLIWYVLLIGINIYWLIKKFNILTDELYKKQIIIFLIGLIITNLASFFFGLFLPWYLGFYYLVEISPLAFLVGVILFTTFAISKYDMFSSTLGKLHNFSITRKIVLSSVVLVPIIILLIQIPVIRFLFELRTNEELSRYFIVSVFSGIIVSISIAFIIIKIISNPLNKLKNKAQEIEKGNYGIQIEFNANDEIGELTNAFNNMSATLKNNSIELRNRENRISLLLNAFEKSSAAIAIVNNRFEIIESNDQFMHIVNKNRTQIINNSIAKVQFFGPLSEKFEHIKHELSVNKKYRGELSFDEKELLVSVTPSKSGTGSEGYLFIEVDVTEQKKLEKQLVKSEKLAALGKMAAVLAHEIKTPLTSIKMNADIIAETFNLGADERENLEIIQTEINRLNDLVKDVLQFSRQTELDYSLVNLFNLMGNIKYQLFKKIQNKKISFANNTAGVEFEADPHKLKQVFLNLINNSIEAIHDHGAIEVSSVVDEEHQNLTINIKDDGIGIKPEVKIFEPFVTTKTSGTGLGLSIAQKIANQHNGSINLVSSSPGKTIFQIILPLRKLKDRD